MQNNVTTLNNFLQKRKQIKIKNYLSSPILELSLRNNDKSGSEKKFCGKTINLKLC